MNIVYICSEYPPSPHGGIGTFVKAITHGMNQLGHKVTVIGWSKTPSEWNDSGIRIITLKHFSNRIFGWLIDRIRLYFWLKKENKINHIDIIETTDYQGPIINNLNGIPVVVRLHLTSAAIKKHNKNRTFGFITFCERRQLSLFRNWIAVSYFSLKLTIETFGIKPITFETIYYPVLPAENDNVTIPSLPNKFVFFAGSINKRKGALILAEASKTFLVNNPEVYLVYAGSIYSEDGISVDKLIIDLVGSTLSKKILFLGRLERDQVLSIMRRASVFVFPSTLETFGLVTGEAMLQGCPVIVCNTGPNPELIKNEVNGILVPSNNSEEISNTVCRLLSDSIFSKNIAKQGQIYISEHFSMNNCLNSSLKYYKNIISRSRVR